MAPGNFVLFDPLLMVQGFCQSIIGYDLTTDTPDKLLISPQNGRKFTNDISDCISLNDDIWILLQSKCDPKCLSADKLALVLLFGRKPLPKPVMLRVHMCTIRSQRVKQVISHIYISDYGWMKLRMENTWMAVGVDEWSNVTGINYIDRSYV